MIYVNNQGQEEQILSFKINSRFSGDTISTVKVYFSFFIYIRAEENKLVGKNQGKVREFGSGG